jgi:hypothetical protein
MTKRQVKINRSMDGPQLGTLNAIEPIRWIGIEWPKRVFISYVLWLVAIGLPILYLLLAAPRLSQHGLVSAVSAAGIVLVLATLAEGWALQGQGFWKYFLPVACSGWVVLMAGYAMLMIGLNGGDPSIDDAAGAGVAILAVPVFALLCFLLILGGGIRAGISFLIKRIKR